MRAVIFALVATATVAHAQPTNAPAPDPTQPPPSPPAETPPAETPPADAPPADAPPAETPPADAPPETTPAQSAPTDTAPADTAPAQTAPAEPPPPAITSSGNKDAAWLFVGGAITFITTGVVLAYSTGSAEQDIRDLYSSPSGGSPTFDGDTRERYDALIAEGERYEKLSWAAFGVAGACAIGAGIFFYRASQETEAVVTPVVTPTSASASFSLRF